MSHDQILRKELCSLLDGGKAHATFEEAIADLPRKLRHRRADKLPHTAWELLEHIRIAQYDILDYSCNPHYKAPKWPDEYWPDPDKAPDDAAWQRSVQQVRADLSAMKALVNDPSRDPCAAFPWAEGANLLREAMLVADHNAYHVAQLITVRRALDAWPG